MSDFKHSQYLTAREAAAELNVSRATLYAYVSRGLLRSEPAAGSRRNLYLAADVRALRSRKSGGVESAEAARGLSWGTPILDSAITLITDDGIFYRGRDAARLARSASLEAVAGLLWDTGEEDPFASNLPFVADVDPALVGVDRCLALLAHAASRDLKAYNRDPAGVARTGARLVRLLAAGMTEGSASEWRVHEVLAARWAPTAAAAPDLIRAALVLLADHELNASAFTVRCIASTNAAPYAAITGGLCALQGPRHGGETARVAAFFEEVDAAGDPHHAVAARLRRGDRLSGFGHPLYPKGDPRAATLFRLLREVRADDPVLDHALRTADAVRELTEQEPTIDFALATLGRVLGLPPHAPIGIFAVGRCVGWVAHAQEQYRARHLIRPRSRYVGPQPDGKG